MLSALITAVAWFLRDVKVGCQSYDGEVIGSTLHQFVIKWLLLEHTGKPSHYITNTKVNSALHPSGVGKSSNGLSGWG